MPYWPPPRLTERRWTRLSFEATPKVSGWDAGDSFRLQRSSFWLSISFVMGSVANMTALFGSSYLAELERSGYALLRALLPEMRSLELAESIGQVVDISRILPRSGLRSVQSLRPTDTNQVGTNQSSGVFGYGRFPLHSDLAHWAVPPRYFFLRCVVGSEDVLTQVLPCQHIVEMLGGAYLERALFVARRKRFGTSGLVRGLSEFDGNMILRWDPVFLKPLNRNAEVFSAVMSEFDWNEQVSEILLGRPGDTLIVDNWRTLHGRSEVSPKSTSRCVERIYFSEVFQ